MIGKWFWIALCGASWFCLAEEPELPYGPTVIPLIVERPMVDGWAWGPDDEIWLEVEYLLSPDDAPVFVDPAERLWFAGEHAVIVLGATGCVIPSEVLRRGMGWVRLRFDGDLVSESPLPIYPRRDQMRLGNSADPIQAALSRRLPGVNASYLSQVAHFLAGNLANLDVQGTSYSVAGYGEVINDSGEWMGEPDVLVVSDAWNNTTNLTNTCQHYDEANVTIDVPGPGRIIVMCSMRMYFSHEVGTRDTFIGVISDTPMDCSDSFSRVQFDYSEHFATELSIDRQFSIHQTFTIDMAGEYTYYLNGYMLSGSATTDSFWYAYMTAMFVPE